MTAGRPHVRPVACMHCLRNVCPTDRGHPPAASPPRASPVSETPARMRRVSASCRPGSSGHRPAGQLSGAAAARFAVLALGVSKGSGHSPYQSHDETGQAALPQRLPGGPLSLPGVDLVFPPHDGGRRALLRNLAASSRPREPKRTGSCGPRAASAPSSWSACCHAGHRRLPTASYRPRRRASGGVIGDRLISQRGLEPLAYILGGSPEPWLSV
jgi:hypothetical protein